MTEDLSTKNPTDDDLLAKIQRETQARLRELRDAVDEHDRLAAELRTLDAPPEPPAVSKPPTALQDVPKPNVVPKPPAAPEPPANVVRLPARPKLPRTRTVSPKIARLMRAPRRPALERSGVVRVGAGRLDPSGGEPGEIDSEAALYERSL
jgi:hypothetical protein